MIVFPAMLRPDVTNTPNKVLLMLLATTWPVTLSESTAASAALAFTTWLSIVAARLGGAPLPMKIPVASTLYTLLLRTVTDSFEVLAFSAQIPTPQVLSTSLVGRTG